MYTHDEVEACARTLHLLAWASLHTEEGGRLPPGASIAEMAPPTTGAARLVANNVISAAIQSNLHANPNDLAHYGVGSGGGSGADFTAYPNLWEGSFDYYVGDDGEVYASISSHAAGNTLPSCSILVAQNAADFIQTTRGIP